MKPASPGVDLRGAAEPPPTATSHSNIHGSNGHRAVSPNETLTVFFFFPSRRGESSSAPVSQLAVGSRTDQIYDDGGRTVGMKAITEATCERTGSGAASAEGDGLMRVNNA